VIRVLLADDQALIRAGFHVLIDAADDLEVVGEATDGAQAVDLARRARADVVLMDIRMPGVDGLEATRRISADDDLAGVKVIILTTFESDEYVYQAIRAGASGFLVKDTEPADLIQAVRVVAKGDALLSPSVTRRLITDLASRPERPPPNDSSERALAGLTVRERQVLGLVAEGLLRIYLLADNGRQVTLHYADPGDIVGAPALLLAGAQSAGEQMRRPWQLLGGRKIHGEALRDTLLLRLSPGQFLRLVRTEVSVAWPLAMFLARRAVAAQQILSDDMFLPIQARVARHVIDLGVPQGDVLVVSAGHQEIADAIGSVREVVSRAMGQMRDEGLITREGNQTVVTDVARLRAIASTG